MAGSLRRDTPRNDEIAAPSSDRRGALVVVITHRRLVDDAYDHCHDARLFAGYAARIIMLETARIAFTTYFATIGPADVAALFAARTAKNTPAERRAMAIRGTLIATGILLVFALFGEAVLRLFGISLPALRIAGGILLLLIAIDMVFGRPSGGTTTTSEETAEAALKDDISVFPLATPLIAGPGAIGATMLLVADAQGDRLRIAVVILVMLGMLLLTFLLLLVATQVHRLLGVTGLHVVSRVVGVLLAALAVQFILDGIRTSGLLA
jgi:multiple antibiotic resistance protein